MVNLANMEAENSVERCAVPFLALGTESKFFSYKRWPLPRDEHSRDTDEIVFPPRKETRFDTLGERNEHAWVCTLWKVAEKLVENDRRQYQRPLLDKRWRTLLERFLRALLFLERRQREQRRPSEDTLFCLALKARGHPFRCKASR